jgi:FMN phosphatase YigB (HAD superfamily)
MYLTTKHALVGRTARYLLFDLGNTLWHGIDPITYNATEKKINDHAVAVLRELLAPTPLPPIDPTILGQRLREMVDQQLRGSLRRNPEVEPDAALVTAYSLYRLGIPPVDPSVSLQVFEALNVRIPERRVLFNDALHTLNMLKERGFSLGVVTNRHWGGESFQEDLYTMGICPLIDLKNIAVSADIGLRKPNPELFRHTLRALNAVPEEAIMVGDSIAADVGGAKRLGLFAVWKPKPRLWLEARSTLSPTINREPTTNPDDQEPSEHHITHKTTTGELRATSRVEGYLLAYASRRSKKLNMLPGTAQPDLIIEHLSELLDVFKQAGVQS